MSRSQRRGGRSTLTGVAVCLLVAVVLWQGVGPGSVAFTTAEAPRESTAAVMADETGVVGADVAPQVRTNETDPLVNVTNNLAADAAAAGEVRTVENVLEDPDWAAWRKPALSRGYQSVVAVPIATGREVGRVAVVYAAEPEAFGERVRRVLRELGRFVGERLRAVERTAALVDDGAVELEFAVGDEGYLFNALSTALGERVELDGYFHRSNGTVQLFLTAPERQPRQWSTAWRSATPLPRPPSSPPRARTAWSTSACGTRSCSNDWPRPTPGWTRSSPPTGERPCRSRSPGRSTSARCLRRSGRPTTTPNCWPAGRARRASRRPARSGRTLRSRLTDRQFEALQAGHEAGFFEWPRDITGEALAEVFDVEPSTFHYHMRAAQRKLVDTPLDPQ